MFGLEHAACQSPRCRFLLLPSLDDANGTIFRITQVNAGAMRARPGVRRLLADALGSRSPSSLTSDVVVSRTEAEERLLSGYILSEELTERSMASLPQIYLTQNDMDHLLKLVEAQPGKRFEKLESELVRANVVSREKIPEDVVTMNSRVIFENETTRERREITLVYPGSADIDAGKISVLVPVGTALLGLRVGQSIDWELPGGEKQRYRIVEVPFQPEAAGEPG